jgi:hypothetical protein
MAEDFLLMEFADFLASCDNGDFCPPPLFDLPPPPPPPFMDSPSLPSCMGDCETNMNKVINNADSVQEIIRNIIVIVVSSIVIIISLLLAAAFIWR